MRKNKKRKSRKRKSKIIYRMIVGLSVVLLVLLGWLLCGKEDKDDTAKAIREEFDESQELEEAKESKNIQNIEDITADGEIVVNEELRIMEIGAYAGRYVEDASNDEVSDVVSIMVVNTGERVVQYAEITLYYEGGECFFPLSTLKPGDSVLVLEANKKLYDETIEYSGMSVESVAYFEGDLNVFEDTFTIQPLDGGFNITNISEEDVAGEIVIYFKNRVDDIYLGGITYRGRVEGGLKAGEIRQIMTDNFSESETEVMFIEIIKE